MSYLPSVRCPRYELRTKSRVVDDENSMIDPRIIYFYKTWYRVPFLVPFWDKREIHSVLKFTSSFGTGDIEGSSETLQVVIQKQFCFPYVVLTSTGRFAIEVALRSLGKPGGEVIVPTFICDAVPRAVLDAGYVPVFADINEDLTIDIKSVRVNHLGAR